MHCADHAASHPVPPLWFPSHVPSFRLWTVSSERCEKIGKGGNPAHASVALQQTSGVSGTNTVSLLFANLLLGLRCHNLVSVAASVSRMRVDLLLFSGGHNGFAAVQVPAKVYNGTGFHILKITQSAVDLK